MTTMTDVHVHERQEDDVHSEMGMIVNLVLIMEDVINITNFSVIPVNCVLLSLLLSRCFVCHFHC